MRQFFLSMGFQTSETIYMIKTAIISKYFLYIEWFQENLITYHLSYMIFFKKKRIPNRKSIETSNSKFRPSFNKSDYMAGFSAGPPPKGSQQYALYDFGHWAVLLASNGLSHLVALALAFTVFFICIVVS